MSRLTLRIAAILFHTAAIAVRAEAAGEPGMREMTADVSERKRAIDVTLWYPTTDLGPVEAAGGTGVFEGTPAQRDATFADGRFPLVVLAHGGLRSAPGLGNWIAAELARRGYIVAVAHAPALAESDAQAAVREAWLRPADLSATLDALEADAGISPHLDEARVGVVGFLRGGTSALMLAGARLDAERFRAGCDGSRPDMDCAWYSHHGVDLHRADAGEIEQSRLDPRVGVSVAIDPELTQSLAAESLAAIRVPVEIISLGEAAAKPPGFGEARLRDLIRGGRGETIAAATRFSSFSECTRRATAILRDTGEEEAICDDGGGRSRAAIHRQLAETIERGLERALRRGGD